MCLLISGFFLIERQKHRKQNLFSFCLVRCRVCTKVGKGATVRWLKSSSYKNRIKESVCLELAHFRLFRLVWALLEIWEKLLTLLSDILLENWFFYVKQEVVQCTSLESAESWNIYKPENLTGQLSILNLFMTSKCSLTSFRNLWPWQTMEQVQKWSKGRWKDQVTDLVLLS